MTDDAPRDINGRRKRPKRPQCQFTPAIGDRCKLVVALTDGVPDRYCDKHLKFMEKQLEFAR